jgi:hypothetical protein
MMTTKQITDVLTVAVVAMGIFVGNTNADTLVWDDFSGAAATDLVGTTADVGGTWIGSGNTDTKADGGCTYNAATPRNAYQPFTLVQGRTYTLSADILVDTGSLAFMGIGFADSSGGVGGNPEIWTASDPYAWLYLNGSATHGIKRFTGNGLAGEVKIGDTVFDTVVNMKVELDTSNAGDYQATWYIDGVDKGSANIGTPALDYVFINTHNKTSGTVDNFLLVDDVAPTATPGTLIYGK